MQNFLKRFFKNKLAITMMSTLLFACLTIGTALGIERAINKTEDTSQVVAATRTYNRAAKFTADATLKLTGSSTSSNSTVENFYLYISSTYDSESTHSAYEYLTGLGLNTTEIREMMPYYVSGNTIYIPSNSSDWFFNTTAKFRVNEYIEIPESAYTNKQKISITSGHIRINDGTRYYYSSLTGTGGAEVKIGDKIDIFFLVN